MLDAVAASSLPLTSILSTHLRLICFQLIYFVNKLIFEIPPMLCLIFLICENLATYSYGSPEGSALTIFVFVLVNFVFVLLFVVIGFVFYFFCFGKFLFCFTFCFCTFVFVFVLINFVFVLLFVVITFVFSFFCLVNLFFVLLFVFFTFVFSIKSVKPDVSLRYEARCFAIC